MRKYYTRACNFYYGAIARKLIKQKLALPLCGNKNIAFDNIEILSREKKKRLISIKNIKKLPNKIKKIISKDLKKITSKRKNLSKYINISKPLIMGVLNLTPDSFSDGGLYNQSKKAYTRINYMISKGADIIDIGGESTRPGSKDIPHKVEWKRLEKIIFIFKKKFPKIFLSIDTRKSEVMLKAIKYKSDLINDVSGFNYDQKAIDKIKNYNIWKVLHHMQGNPATMQVKPSYKNVLLDIYDFFEKKINIDFKNTKYKKFIIDPGIGFGKNLKHNLILMHNISLFHSLGFPLLIGTSRKRFINQISSRYDSKERIGGTVASVLYTLRQGVQIFRVHNVIEVKQAILVFKKISSIK
jgi:dihydropteroate synthase|tara:strand:- start:6010 stop:7074 length:1065 start_codon:yes stop_codon:yes gene_type:complete